MKTISLYSGAGGLDLGGLSAGAEILASLEVDKDCCATLRRNASPNVICGRAEDTEPRELRLQLGLAVGELDLLMGGPPCQPFSKSAQWTSKAALGFEDPRAKALQVFFDYVREFKPRAILIENVEGFGTHGGLELADALAASITFGRSKYSSAWGVLDASDFGVPQRRRRLFWIALRGGREFKFPAPTHGHPVPKATAWDAISRPGKAYSEDLSLRGRWASLVASVPPGENYLWHTDRGGGKPLFGWRTKYWSFLLKLRWDKAAPTIVANPSQNHGPFHWNNRLLSTWELAALQSFPATYQFAGDRTSRHRQIGNAVPPLLAEVLLLELAVQMGLAERRQPKLLVPRVETRPRVRKLQPVSAEHAVLAGTHPAHGGTGKGPRPRVISTPLLEAAE